MHYLHGFGKVPIATYGKEIAIFLKELIGHFQPHKRTQQTFIGTRQSFGIYTWLCVVLPQYLFAVQEKLNNEKMQALRKKILLCY